MLDSIEQVALVASPTLEEHEYDGWLLRYAEGQSKRANSVNVLRVSNQPLADKIAYCEAWYAQRNANVMHRVTSISPERDIDSTLERGGYTRIDETFTLWRRLSDVAHQPSAASTRLRLFPLETWLNYLHGLRGESEVERDRHARRLSRIQRESVFAALESHDSIVACGNLILDARFAGLFNIITAKDARGQGFGAALTAGMLAVAASRGAEYAYLQVSASNTPAVRLYDRLQFTEAYRYWYRTKPT